MDHVLKLPQYKYHRRWIVTLVATLEFSSADRSVLLWGFYIRMGRYYTEHIAQAIYVHSISSQPFAFSNGLTSSFNVRSSVDMKTFHRALSLNLASYHSKLSTRLALERYN